MKNTRPGWIDSRYKDYSWGELADAQNKWDLARAQERQNELLEEQNKLLSGNNYNTVYRYTTSDDITILGLLSLLSIIPIALGFIMTFLTMGDGIEQGIKILLAGLVCPVLQGLIHIIKVTKKDNQERKLRRNKEKARQARIERKLNKTRGI